jgi:hypothetical protein
MSISSESKAQRFMYSMALLRCRDASCNVDQKETKISSSRLTQDGIEPMLLIIVSKGQKRKGWHTGKVSIGIYSEEHV